LVGDLVVGLVARIEHTSHMAKQRKPNENVEK
jgi:hypothetical protein